MEGGRTEKWQVAKNVGCRCFQPTRTLLRKKTKLATFREILILSDAANTFRLIYLCWSPGFSLDVTAFWDPFMMYHTAESLTRVMLSSGILLLFLSAFSSFFIITPVFQLHPRDYRASGKSSKLSRF